MPATNSSDDERQRRQTRFALGVFLPGAVAIALAQVAMLWSGAFAQLLDVAGDAQYFALITNLAAIGVGIIFIWAPQLRLPAGFARYVLPLVSMLFALTVMGEVFVGSMVRFGEVAVSWIVTGTVFFAGILVLAANATFDDRESAD